MNLQDCERFAIEQLDKWRLYDWHFEFDNARRRFGCCKYSKKCITVSRYLCEINSDEDVRDVVLHELAHALAGHGAGHGYLWKYWCNQVGAKPERCYDSNKINTPPAKYTGHCPSCDRVIKKHRRNRIACGQCCNAYNNGKYSEQYRIVWA